MITEPMEETSGRTGGRPLDLDDLRLGRGNAGSTVVRCQPEHLLKLRLVVARVGEMDLARWWNTNGQLGPLGASVVRRGFRRTHYFAQARSVFAVAAHRCREVYDRPGTVTLWNLPAEIEDEFELRLEDGSTMRPAGRASLSNSSRARRISRRSCCDFSSSPTPTPSVLRKLRRAAEQRAVPVPGSSQARQMT